MKAIKYLLSAVLLFSVIWSCDDDFGSIEFVDTAVAPSNLTATFEPTQDNSGVVTITPNGEGVVSYSVDFGDGSSPETLQQGESINHTYAEGTYDVKLVGTGITGLKGEASVPLNVSFQAPIINPDETFIVNSQSVSKGVEVTVSAQFAISYDVYFGEPGMDDPVSANIGETIYYAYAEPGTYTITVVVKGTAIETTEFTQEFEAIAIVQPIASAPNPPARFAGDVISIFTTAYENVPGTNYFPDWGQAGQGSSWAMFDLNGDEMLNYINLSYQGIHFGETVDVSNMEYIHMDVWTADVAKIETSLINGVDGNSTEAPVWRDLTADEWTSIDIPISEWTEQGLTVDQIFQLKFVGNPWAAGSVFIDNIYFWKEPEPASGLEGMWVVAPEAGALKVGPSKGSGEWWTSDAQAVIDRACFFDDIYNFSLDGSFKNELGAETWVEGWQGGSDSCAAPVAPHDGSNPATFVYDAGANTVTLTGEGAYLGIPKANNQGELPNVPVPSSVTYEIELLDNNNTMNVYIEAGSGVWWTYKLIRYISPVAGTWKMAPEAGSLAVGPAPGSTEWWAVGDQDVIDRACYFDDEYVFDVTGAFSNVLQGETWIEGWQGGGDTCGAPVAPHDGSSSAWYTYDATNGKLTVYGVGAYIGLPKANNQGELPNVDVPNSITYNVVLSEGNTVMNMYIETGTGVFWSYKLVKN